MPKNDNTTLSEGAGATRSQSGSRTTASGSYGSETYGSDTSRSGSYGNDDYYADRSRSRSREVVISDYEENNRPERATIVGAALAGAVIGAAIPFMLGRSSSGGRSERSRSRQESALVTESIVINKPARELYDFWRDFTNLSKFMDNIKSVEKLDDKRSHWVIKAPAGTSVEFDSRVVDDVPGRLISWESEEGASVPNRGRVEFVETSSGGSTNVMATISYDPPAGAAGRMVAKLFQREPGVQAREDLARLKRLMETGSAD